MRPSKNDSSHARKISDKGHKCFLKSINDREFRLWLGVAMRVVDICVFSKAIVIVSSIVLIIFPIIVVVIPTVVIFWVPIVNIAVVVVFRALIGVLWPVDAAFVSVLTCIIIFIKTDFIPLIAIVRIYRFAPIHIFRSPLPLGGVPIHLLAIFIDVGIIAIGVPI